MPVVCSRMIDVHLLMDYSPKINISGEKKNPTWLYLDLYCLCIHGGFQLKCVSGCCLLVCGLLKQLLYHIVVCAQV